MPRGVPSENPHSGVALGIAKAGSGDRTGPPPFGESRFSRLGHDHDASVGLRNRGSGRTPLGRPGSRGTIGRVGSDAGTPCGSEEIVSRLMAGAEEESV